MESQLWFMNEQRTSSPPSLVWHLMMALAALQKKILTSLSTPRGCIAPFSLPARSMSENFP